MTTLAIPAKKKLTFPQCDSQIVIPQDYNRRRTSQIRPRTIRHHHTTMIIPAPLFCFAGFFSYNKPPTKRKGAQASSCL
jgi:hypothetical protein